MYTHEYFYSMNMITCKSFVLLAILILLYPSRISSIIDLSKFSDGSPHLKTGTTICGILCSDGVVIGADSRRFSQNIYSYVIFLYDTTHSTSGPIVANLETQKIRRVAPSILIAGAGTSADCESISRHVCHMLALEKIDLLEALSSNGMQGVGIGYDSPAYCLRIIREELSGEGRLKGIRKPEAVFIIAAAEIIGVF